MTVRTNARALLAAFILVAAALMPTSVLAELADYEFQLVEPTVKTGDATIIAVRLLNKKSGVAVSDAVIFASRLDMAPDSMSEMTTKLTPLPTTSPGVYSFKANVSMAGGWQLSLAAKVQGETGTVANKLIIKAEL